MSGEIELEFYFDSCKGHVIQKKCRSVNCLSKKNFCGYCLDCKERFCNSPHCCCHLQSSKNENLQDEKDLVIEICKNKIKFDDNKFDYSITPEIDYCGWSDAIFEARGYGIPVYSFCDTRDKVVLHPGHLDYDFDYELGKATWSDKMWKNDIDDKIREEALNKLFLISKYLINKYKIWIVYPDSDSKGYLNTIIKEFSEFTTFDEFKNRPRTYYSMWRDIPNVVLFVFGFDPEEWLSSNI